MSKLKYNGKWNDVKKRLMDKYSILTKEDFEYEKNDDKLLNHLEHKLGKESDEIRQIIRRI